MYMETSNLSGFSDRFVRAVSSPAIQIPQTNIPPEAVQQRLARPPSMGRRGIAIGRGRSANARIAARRRGAQLDGMGDIEGWGSIRRAISKVAAPLRKGVSKVAKPVLTKTRTVARGFVTNIVSKFAGQKAADEIVEKLESEASNVGQKLEQRIQGGGQSPVASAVAASGEGYGSYYSQDGQDRQKPGIMDSIPKTALIAGAVVAAGGIYLLARRK